MPFLLRIRTRTDYLGTILTAFLILLITVAANAESGAPEIANGTFEQSDAEGNPESWSLQVRGLSVDLDDATTGEGGKALKISDTGSGGSALIKQEFDLGPSGFAGATLRGRIRTRGIAPSATLVAILEGPEGRIFMDDMSDRVVRGDTEWQEYRVYIPAAEDARSLTVGALVIGTGTAWFDDLELIDDSQNATMDMDARAYALEALSIMRENYLHADEVDWDRIRETALESTSDNASREQAHAVVSMMIEDLNDPHASFVRPTRSNSSKRTQIDTFEPVTAEMATKRIALIRVPSVPGSTAEKAQVAFAENAHKALKSINSPALCGWIVDLRDNTGGNMWPMLAAIGPIAGPGVLGQFIGPEGEETTKWTYGDGAALVSTGDETIARIAISTQAFQPTYPDLPVAVLVSGRTSSSGEATAIAFIGRENTRLFGSETGGLTTANNVYPLSDGARVVFPIGHMADRHGNIHHPGVEPDETVSSDGASEAAIAWLESQSVCQD